MLAQPIIKRMTATKVFLFDLVTAVLQELGHEWESTPTLLYAPWTGSLSAVQGVIRGTGITMQVSGTCDGTIIEIRATNWANGWHSLASVELADPSSLDRLRRIIEAAIEQCAQQNSPLAQPTLSP